MKQRAFLRCHEYVPVRASEQCCSAASRFGTKWFKDLKTQFTAVQSTFLLLLPRGTHPYVMLCQVMPGTGIVYLVYNGLLRYHDVHNKPCYFPVFHPQSM